MKTKLLSWVVGPWLLLGSNVTPVLAQPASPFVEQQEPVVVTEHQTRVGDRQVTYRARAGKLPIRDVGTGEIRASMFYVAYDLKPESGAKPRPVAFLWGGGPGGPGVPMDLGYFGRAIDADSARHLTTRCYINGHRMAVDPDNIARLATDVRAFIAAPPSQGSAAR